ncbi:hypothetical protein JB92DRAFT_2833895 [Gautieria morchelliformis]|nr:hypothetical protein JB92DRAFT_2833895 [Gautieria morchelliformis]
MCFLSHVFFQLLPPLALSFVIMVKASKHTSKAKSNPKKTSSPRPSYKERHKLYMQQLEDAKGSEPKQQTKKNSKNSHKYPELLLYSTNDSRSHQYKRKDKKIRALIPKPFGAAGKKGTGEHGSKGYNLKEHMGLESDGAKYLDIRAAVRDEVVSHHLEGRKRKQDPQKVALILRSVEKRFPELKQYENSFFATRATTRGTRNDTGRPLVPVCHQEQQERQERQEQHEEVHVSLEENGEERATVLQEAQAQELAVDSNDAGDAEDEQGDVEDQGEDDHEVLGIYLCRADDLTLNFNVQQNPSEDRSQTLSDSDSYALESDAAT